jgi:hypothetical protein
MTGVEMNTPRRIGLCHGAAVVLASAAAISLTALSAGMVPALADDPPYVSTDPTLTTDPEATASGTAEESPEPSASALATPTAPVTTPSESSSSMTEIGETFAEGTSTTPSEAVSTPSASAAASATVTPSVVTPSASAGPIVKPERLTADADEVKLAKSSPEVPSSTPEMLQQSQIEDITASVADRNVMQWQPDWVDQDENLRPVIINPFPYPIQVVYSDNGDPRTVTIQPSTRTVLDFVESATSVTVMVFDAVGQLTNVAVANAFRGPPPDTDTDVPVVVHDKDVTYRPIVVDQVTDLGEDPDVGMRKVLLDGGTPAWGVWAQNREGKRQFEVRKTQQLPGIDAPAEGLPPGYRLVADTEPLTSTDVLLIVLAIVIAGVAIGATVRRVIRRKQRVSREQRDHHNRDERPDTRVEARSLPGGPLGVAVRETPAPVETTHVLRLETHSHPRTLTIEEVNDDHSRPA